jgi:hypothetical protein
MNEPRTRTPRRPARAAAPVFDALLAEAKRTPPEELVAAAELDQRRPLTPEEIAAADAEVDRLLREDADGADGPPAARNGRAPRPEGPARPARTKKR